MGASAFMGTSAFTGATIGAPSDLGVAAVLVFVSVFAVVSVVFAGLCFLVLPFFGVALAGSVAAVFAGIVALAAGAGAAAAAGGVAGAGAAGAVVVVCATAGSEMARALALSAINSLFMSCPLSGLRVTRTCVPPPLTRPFLERLTDRRSHARRARISLYLTPFGTPRQVR